MARSQKDVPKFDITQIDILVRKFEFFVIIRKQTKAKVYGDCLVNFKLKAVAPRLKRLLNKPMKMRSLRTSKIDPKNAASLLIFCILFKRFRSFNTVNKESVV